MVFMGLFYRRYSRWASLPLAAVSGSRSADTEKPLHYARGEKFINNIQARFNPLLPCKNRPVKVEAHLIPFPLPHIGVIKRSGAFHLPIFLLLSTTIIVTRYLHFHRHLYRPSSSVQKSTSSLCQIQIQTLASSGKTMQHRTFPRSPPNKYTSTCLPATLKYNSSSFFRAQGVFRKNFKLDLMLGPFVKQWDGTRLPSSSQPYCSASRVRSISSVIPCRGLVGCSVDIRAWAPSRSTARR